MTLLSRIPSIALSLLAIIAVYIALTLAHLMGIAHASTQSLPATWSVDLASVIEVLVAFLIGVLAMLGAVIKALGYIAPRTTTTVDDRALVHLQDIKTVLEEAVGFLRGISPQPVIPQQKKDSV